MRFTMKSVAAIMITGLFLAPVLIAQQNPMPPGKDRQGDPLPEGAIARLGTMKFHNSESIHTVAFTPEGQQLLVFAHHYPNTALRFWNLADGNETARFDLKDADYPEAWFTRSVRLTADGKEIVLMRENVIELLDRQSGKSLHVFTGKSKFHGMDLSPDGTTVALATHGTPKTSIHFWEIAKGESRPPLHLETDWYFAMKYSSDGKRLLIGVGGKKDGGILQVWEIDSGKKLHEIEVDNHFYAAFSPDGQLVATRNETDDVRVQKVADGATACRFKAPANGMFHSFAFTPDGKSLITITPGQTPCLWDATTGKRLRAFGGLPASSVQMGDFSADGKRFALIVGGRWENSVRLWNVETGEEIRPYEGHADAVAAVAFAPNGKLLASGSWDTTVRLWEPRTGKELGVLRGHTERVLALAFSPDGAILASASADGTTRLWRMPEGKEVTKLDGPAATGARRDSSGEREGMKLIFAADGKSIFGVDDLGGYRAWDTATGRTLARKRFGDNQDHVIGVSSDGGTALTYRHGNWQEDEKEVAPESLSLWNATTGERERMFRRRRTEGNRYDTPNAAAELSRDGRLLAGSSRSITVWKYPLRPHYTDPALRIWERLSGQEILSLDTYPRALAFSFDGKRIAGNDRGNDIFGYEMIFLPGMGSVHLWDTMTGKRQQTFAHHNAEVRCVAFSPDGKTLASGSGDHTILVWDCTGSIRDVTPIADPSAKELDEWWNALADDHAKVARNAMAEFVRRPTSATRFLGDRLKPATSPDPKKIAAMVLDLSSPNFATREAATDALVQMGEIALLTLSKALDAEAELETSRRLKEIVRRATNISYRTLRAIAVLEEIADDGAVRVLESLSKGAAESRQTAEAQATLRRLRPQ
jgi:WD40 repeat protein